jgi:hypothetical protein
MWSPEYTGKVQFYQPVMHDDFLVHMALINLDNVVVQTIQLNPSDCFDENNLHSETKAIELCNKIVGTPDGHFWKQTFRNDIDRGYYGVPGSTWDDTKQIFLVERPFKGWVVNENNFWESPTDKPLGSYIWSDAVEDWVLETNYTTVIGVDGINTILDEDGNPLDL